MVFQHITLHLSKYEDTFAPLLLSFHIRDIATLQKKKVYARILTAFLFILTLTLFFPESFDFFSVVLDLLVAVVEVD